MKKNLLIIIWSILMQLNTVAQSKSGIENYSILGNKQSYVWMPVVHHTAKSGMYTEMRYNYEAEGAGSVYAGKSFILNRTFNYAITPMAGIVVGKYNGISLAGNMEFAYKKFFAGSQSQYTVNENDAGENFFFNWTEAAWQPFTWLYTGSSMQQTKTRNNRVKSEYGLLTGFVFKKFSVPVYVFSPFSKNPSWIVGISAEW